MRHIICSYEIKTCEENVEMKSELEVVEAMGYLKVMYEDFIFFISFMFYVSCLICYQM